MRVLFVLIGMVIVIFFMACCRISGECARAEEAAEMERRLKDG